MDQLLIAITGTAAIWLANDENVKRRKWAPIFGLAGQPFWMWSAATAEQWGILALTLSCTVAWLKGLKTHWLS